MRTTSSWPMTERAICSIIEFTALKCSLDKVDSFYYWRAGVEYSQALWVVQASAA
ncbi:hypothetical protein GCM10007052_28060 [Halioglobus japonicus]|nr:hypothetical protein GCM10007052_28060 [Halioglobus japonicus]